MTAPLLLAFYGDDFTGSTDALEFLARAGVRTVLFIEPPTPAQLVHYPGIQAVGVAGLTRSLPTAALEAELWPAFAALSTLGAEHVHYKICSTFDSSPSIGSIGHAIDVGAEIFDAKFVPLLVGAPVLGRYCVFGNLFARLGGGGEIHRLDRHPSMSKHPVTPSDESDLRLHLAKQTAKRIALFDILKVALPETSAQAELAALVVGGAEIILFDILYPDQLGRIGGLLDAQAGRQKPFFSVGSSGIEMALGAHWAAQGRLKQRTSWPDPGPASPLLAVSGSCSPVTTKQISWALAHGFTEVALDAAKVATESEAPAVLVEVVSHLKKGRSVVVHTSKGGLDPRITPAVSSRLGTALGRIALNAVEQAGIRRVLFAGGDSSSHAARALGVKSLEMLAPLAPGAPLCKAHIPGSVANGLFSGERQLLRARRVLPIQWQLWPHPARLR